MKKIALLTVFSFFAISAFSQDQGFQFGFHASPTITWISNNADNEAIVKEGTSFAFKVGADGEYYFRENYAFKFGLGMTFNQGGNLVFNTIDQVNGTTLFADSQPDLSVMGTPKVKYKYQYIEFPFGLKMRTNEMGYLRYFAEIPVLTLGFNVAARGQIDDGSDFKISKDTGFMQMSWGLGAGAEYAVSESTSIVAGLYFQSGFINTYYGKTNIPSIDDTKTIVNGVEIRIGILF